jgi:anti-sigma regulatory factor (Ser/Thr protein kinase)
MNEVPNLWLKLSNAPGSLAVVHQALSAVAAVLGLDALETDDLRTAAAEACKNVVYHAYEGGEGPLEVELHTLLASIEVMVRDHGIGIRPHVGERTQPHTGIGMPIVHMLSQRVLYSNLDDGGTEVRMRLAMPNVAPLVAAAQMERAGESLESWSKSGGEDRPEGDPQSTIAMALAPSGLAGAVLPPVLGALATRASFTTTGAAEAERLAQTLAASASDAVASGPLRINVEVAPQGLALRVGPLGAGMAEGVLAATTAALRASAQCVLDGPRVVRSERGELLELRLRERV